MPRVKWAVATCAAALIAAGFVLQQDTAQQAAAEPIETIQPIPFPHDVHAGANQMQCQYCHSSADRSPDAGIPAVQVCAGCHMPGGVPMVALDRPGVQDVIAYAQAGEPIPWVRIHDLPDHVHFPHMMHVNAGLECQECHGPVEEMAEMEQFASLQMGWCVECHRQREARTDCFVCHY